MLENQPINYQYFFSYKKIMMCINLFNTIPKFFFKGVIFIIIAY